MHYFISFKYDFHVYAERMIVNARNVKNYLRQWFKKCCMARYLFEGVDRGGRGYGDKGCGIGGGGCGIGGGGCGIGGGGGGKRG